MTLGPNDLILWRDAQEQRVARDPLTYFKCSSRGQEQVAEYVAKGVEVYAHAGERAGKSKIGCALDAAFCLGRDYLTRRDGSRIAIPVLDPPVRWVLGFDSYKLGGAAVIPTLKGLLGVEGEDYRVENATTDCPSVIHVRHAKARNEAEWSRIHVFPYDGVRPRSMELDGWHCDEPPPVAYLEALRARRGARRKLRGFITSTPLERRFWYPIRKQYPERECEVVDGMARVRWSVFDNEALPDAVKESLRLSASKSSFVRAKLYGDHVDAAGGNPWADLPGDPLGRAMGRTRPPDRAETIVIQAERNDSELVEVSARVHFWGEHPIPGDPYYIVGDPAKGISDGKHDPDGLIIRNIRTREYCGELVSYLGAWGLGNAMVLLARRFNNAILDPLTTGGYGGPLLSAIRTAGYGHCVRDRIEERPGYWRTTIGTVETTAMRGAMIAAVERALLTGTLDCPSAHAIQTLADCMVDENGKIAAQPGAHDELLACLGRSEIYLGDPKEWPKPKPREEVPKVLTMAEIMAAQAGRPITRKAVRTLESVNGP